MAQKFRTQMILVNVILRHTTQNKPRLIAPANIGFGDGAPTTTRGPVMWLGNPLWLVGSGTWLYISSSDDESESVSPVNGVSRIWAARYKEHATCQDCPDHQLPPFTWQLLLQSFYYQGSTEQRSEERAGTIYVDVTTDDSTTVSRVEPKST